MDALGIGVPSITCLGVAAWGAFHPRSQLFGPTVSKVEKSCALTFDDGPNSRVTPQLLSLLERYRITATFFVLGKYVQQDPGLLADVAARGHVIGNHTYDHPNLLFLRRKHIVEELHRCEDTIVRAVGRRSHCVRPPFGFRGPQFNAAAREAGFGRVVMWSVSARDWNLQSWQRVSHRVRRAATGDILLFHDGDHRRPNADRSHTLKALEFWLPRWQDSGFTFTSLG